MQLSALALTGYSGAEQGLLYSFFKFVCVCGGGVLLFLGLNPGPRAG